MTAFCWSAGIRENGLSDSCGSIFDDQPTVILLILSGCFEFFRWQICIVIGGDFQWNMHNLVQKTGTKIIDVTRSTLFYFISSRELH